MFHVSRTFVVFTSLDTIQHCANKLQYVCSVSWCAEIEQCIYMLNLRHLGHHWGSVVYIWWLHRNNKDTPPHCGCRRRWFWACRLWSFWRARPATVHRGRLSPRPRSGETLLLSGHTALEAPETTRKESHREIRWRGRKFYSGLFKKNKKSDYNLNNGIWIRL